MVISLLAGGLGNQLFQYAFGFRLARQLNTVLRLERHLLESRALAQLRHYTPRQYELDVLTAPQKTASAYDVLRSLGRTLLPGNRAILLRETGTEYQEHLFGQTQDIICVGYWQSEAYFKSEAEALRQQLTFRKRPSDATQAVADTILSGSHPTFVHIRRGDYVNNVSASQHHGLCSKSYYQQAARYLHERVSDASFFIFSDDMDWVKRELGTLFQPATFVEHNSGDDSWQDMYLMSLCRHAILANSSFSWWGAWLNPIADRIVIAPRQWFKVKKSVHPAVIPSRWINL